jgi:hypothetical protein
LEELLDHPHDLLHGHITSVADDVGVLLGIVGIWDLITTPLA